MTDRVLVIGYGNTLRTDDGVGQRVAERLEVDQRLAGATVIHVHQLAPELALDMSHADLVVLVDAGHSEAVGAFTIDRVAPANDARTTWSHHLDPASLVALAAELYGHTPIVYLVTIGVQSVEVGDRLSPAVERALSPVVDAIAELVAGRAAIRVVAGATHA